MEKLPYFPLYVDDFVSSSDVEAMRTKGVGCYVLLLCRAWRETPAGTLPDDDGLLACWARVTASEWTELKPRVMAAFKQGNDGRWHQDRMKKEYEIALKKYKEKQKKGLKGANARWHRHSTGIAQAMPCASGSKSTEDRRSEGLRRETDDQVLELYRLFPRQKGKGAALKAIRKALTLADFETLKRAVLRHCEEIKDREIDKTPYPATWFNQQRWEDMPDAGGNEFKHDAAGEREILESIDPEEYEAWKRENA